MVAELPAAEPRESVRETYMQVKKQQLEPDMEQWTGSKLRKEYIKAVYCLRPLGWAPTTQTASPRPQMSLGGRHLVLDPQEMENSSSESRTQPLEVGRGRGRPSLRGPSPAGDRLAPGKGRSQCLCSQTPRVSLPLEVLALVPWHQLFRSRGGVSPPPGRMEGAGGGRGQMGTLCPWQDHWLLQ